MTEPDTVQAITDSAGPDQPGGTLPSRNDRVQAGRLLEAGYQLTCPWHGSSFRVADGSVARGPATAPQPVFQVREVGGALQVMLPGAG